MFQKILIITVAVSGLGRCLFPQVPFRRVLAHALFCKASYPLIEKIAKTRLVNFPKWSEKVITQLLYFTIALIVEKVAIRFFKQRSGTVAKILALFCLCFPCFGSDALQKLSLEEKVGQLLMVHFHGEVANEEARALIQDTKVGGIIYYNWSNTLGSPEQVRVLSEGLQRLAKANSIPLLIAADQEGGVVARLSEGFTKFPGNGAIGQVGDSHLAKRAAFAMGQELQAVGINMNLAPVVDVNSNPRNPVIGIRSFGEDPEIVSDLGRGALEGYKEAQVIATLKHFPGYGDVAVDPHEDLPVVRKTKEELEQVELLPFARLGSLAEAIMTAHILVPALDAENCSTLSEKTLTYLRETIGFQGLIVADSLVMEGVVKKCHTVDEAAILALKAGCDILILGGKLLNGEHSGFELTVADVQRIHGAIVNAVKSGRISEARVNQATQRILDLKRRYIVPGAARDIQLSQAVSTVAHRAIAQEIASLALKMTKSEQSSIGSLHEKKIAVFAPQLLSDTIATTSFSKIGNFCFFSGLAPSNAEIESAKQKAKEADLLFICSYNAWKNPSQATLIQSLMESGKPVVLLVMRDPLDASLFPAAHLIFKTFSPSAPSIQAIYDALTKEGVIRQNFSRKEK